MERYRLMLTLFGEGSGASGGAAAGAAGAAGGEGAAQGAQPQGGAAQQTTDRAAEFDRLIKNEYREEYDKRFREGLNRRFKPNRSGSRRRRRNR